MKNILLIEDNLEMRENTAEILELSGYKVKTAENGKEGVRLAQLLQPDLIICDIMMPELDGYSVLHMLGNDVATVRIPFIFLTAKAEKSDQRKGMSMGADDYLTKPFDDVELLQAVDTRLKKSEILKMEFTRNSGGLDHFLQETKHYGKLENLAENRKTRSFKKKEIIYNEDSFPAGVFFLESGKVKTRKTNELGKEYITELYKEGDFFGYVDLLEGFVYQDSAIALEDSIVSFIPKEDFFNLLYSNRDVATRFIKMLSNEIREREQRLLKLAYNSVRKRAAEALVMLYERYGRKEDKSFAMAITREDIAGIVGTATETVIRTLSDFKEEGLIEMKGSLITIHEYERLLKMRN